MRSGDIFGLFKKKPKSEYAEAVSTLLSYTSFSITNEGDRVISNHEQTGDYSWMFSASFVFMNGVCNQLCDDVGNGRRDPMATQIRTLEVTMAATAFLKMVMDDQQNTGLMSKSEVEFIFCLQEELLTQPSTRFQRMLDLGKLAEPQNG